MWPLHTIFGLASTFATSFNSGTRDTNEAWFDPTFNQFVQDLLLELHVPGLSIAVVDNGAIYSRGYGIANFPNIEATADTLWYTGSTTKAFVAAAAGILVDDDSVNLTWTSRIHDILPAEFDLEDEYATRHVTLEDALSHRSGLPRHDLSYGWDNTTRSLARTLKWLPLTAEPRTRFQYCNVMYQVAGYVLEHVTHGPLVDLLRDRLWKPLGMATTTFSLEGARNLANQGRSPGIARGYYWVAPKSGHNGYYAPGYYVPEVYTQVSTIEAAGAVISSVNDYALWIRSWLQAAPKRLVSNTSSPISRNLFRSVLTPRTLGPQIPSPLGESTFLNPPKYALGWFSETYKGHNVVRHNGIVAGFGSEVYLLPDNDFGVVVMANTAGTSNIVGEQLVKFLVRRKLGVTNTEVSKVTYNLKTEGLDLSTFPFVVRDNDLQAAMSQILAQDVEGATASLGESLEDMAGVYRNPAYGLFIVNTTQHDEQLLVTPSSRLWQIDLVLKPRSTKFFDVEIRFIHGTYRADPVPGLNQSCPAPVCQPEIVYETYMHSLAKFEADPDGNIARLGVQLDQEMVLQAFGGAGGGGPDAWRKSMIWFDRVSSK